MLIIGLGNPTEKYSNTFHNLGFLAVDALGKVMGKRIIKSECRSLTAVKTINGEKIVLAKPLTYMNLSGLAVKELMAKYKKSAEELLIIYDDTDLERFSVRARGFGGAGTHNGMRNITEEIKTTDFKRIRIGIGKTDYDLASYVLSDIGKEDRQKYDLIIAKLALIIEQYIKTKDFDKLLREANILGNA